MKTGNRPNGLSASHLRNSTTLNAKLLWRFNSDQTKLQFESLHSKRGKVSQKSFFIFVNPLNRENEFKWKTKMILIISKEGNSFYLKSQNCVMCSSPLLREIGGDCRIAENFVSRQTEKCCRKVKQWIYMYLEMEDNFKVCKVTRHT